MTDDESRVWLDGWCEDLGHLSDAEIAYGCGRYRRSGQTFFPTPGVLIPLCKPVFADKPGKSQGRQTDHGFQPWNGACQCDACMKQTPREGLYRAPNADHARDAHIRANLDYAMEQKLGYDPKGGNPAMDDTVDKQRSPAELKAILSSTRTAYPGPFRKSDQGNPDKPSGIYVHKLSDDEMAVLKEKRGAVMRNFQDADQ